MGGYTSEHDISLKSGAVVMAHIDKEVFEPYSVRIDKDAWLVEVDGDRAGQGLGAEGRLRPGDSRHPVGIAAGIGAVLIGGQFARAMGDQFGQRQGLGRGHVGLAPAAAFDVVPAFAAKSAEELLSDDGFLEEIGTDSKGFVENWCSPPPATAAFAVTPLTARPYPRRLSELSVELTTNSAVAR